MNSSLNSNQIKNQNAPEYSERHTHTAPAHTIGLSHSVNSLHICLILTPSHATSVHHPICRLFLHSLTVAAPETHLRSQLRPLRCALYAGHLSPSWRKLVDRTSAFAYPHGESRLRKPSSHSRSDSGSGMFSRQISSSVNQSLVFHLGNGSIHAQSMPR